MTAIKRLKSFVIAMLRNRHWREDLSRIGTGLVIAGVATPALSERASFLSGLIIVTIGIVLMIVARAKEA